MKRCFFSLLLSAMTLALWAEDEDVMLVFMNDGSFKGFYTSEVDSVVCSNYDLDSIWHQNAVVQEVWMADSVCRLLLEDIDSISYKVPDPVYQPDVVKLDERYLPYIQSSNGMTVTFSSDMPDDLRPHKGDVLLYEGSNNVFPNGFVGRVTEENGSEMVCDTVEVGDVYERYVFFGSYRVVENKQDGGYQAVAMRNVTSTENDDDWGIKEWESGTVVGPAIKNGLKFKFPKIHTTVAAEVTYTPSFTLEFAYCANIYAPNLYFKCTTSTTSTTKLKVSYTIATLDKEKMKFDLDDEWFKNFNGSVIEKDTNDEPDTDGGQSIPIVDKEVPIPEAPILSSRMRFGLFVKPELKADVSYTYEMTSTVEKTYIYRRTSLIGDPDANEWYDGEKTEETTNKLEGSLKGSVWAGVEFGFSLETTGKKKAEESSKWWLKNGFSLDLAIKTGFTIEGELDFDFTNGIKNKSLYSTLNETKLKTGLKVGGNLSFDSFLLSHQFPNVTLLDVSKTFFEHNYYLFPSFSDIKYSANGKSLTASARVERETLGNMVGFRIEDENGNIIDKKCSKFVSLFGDFDHDIMSETFDGLDFDNHFYTIVPVAEPMLLLFAPFPAQPEMVVTCDNSDHHHFVDLDLPSGTQWSCCNVYADTPLDAGGYYQWGKPYMVNNYSREEYSEPDVVGVTIQGTEFDAATGNWGPEYVTPSLAQFEELFSNCVVTPKKDPWGNKVEGLFLKGLNGKFIYLPFSNYKSGINVVEDSNDAGYYLYSDLLTQSEVANHVYYINDVLHQSINLAHYYGYSVRPVKDNNTWDLDVSSNSIKFGEVAVGRSATEDITITNPTNAAISFIITNEQKDSQFSIVPQMDIYTLGAHQPMTLSVNYNPTKVGQCVEWLVLSSPNGNNKTILSLSGTGIQNNAPVDGAVDLGLPSGTLWAECNVGATSKEQRGDLFAWAETQGYSSGKTSFSWSGYKYCNRAANKLTKYCTKSYYGNNGFTDNRTVLEYGDDAAAANLTGNWRMPTVEEWNELATNCTWTSATVKGVNGCLITGKNGNTLFLPAAGYRDGASLYDADEAYYWTSSLDVNSPDDAWFFYFGDGHRNRYDYYRSMGRSVRPVYDEYMGREEADGQAAAVSVRRPATQPEPVRLTLADGKIIAIQCHSAEDN